MRYFALAFVATALAACGGDNKGADTAAAMGDTAASAPAGSMAPATGTAAPVTGTTHTVNMVQNAQGEFRFDPANMTVKQGDAVKFVVVSGAPHNVAFEKASLPAGAAGQLVANIPNAADTPETVASEMLLSPNQEVTISFAGVPAGTYNYNCTPHLAMGMRGVITVQ